MIGSQAVLGRYPQAPARLLISQEIDIYAPAAPKMSDMIDAALGLDTHFWRTFGFYIDGVGPDTARLAPDWQDWLIPVCNANTNGATGWCLEPHDIAVAKYFAGREKDLRDTGRRPQPRRRYRNEPARLTQGARGLARAALGAANERAAALTPGAAVALATIEARARGKANRRCKRSRRTPQATTRRTETYAVVGRRRSLKQIREQYEACAQVWRTGPGHTARHGQRGIEQREKTDAQTQSEPRANETARTQQRI